MRRIYGIGLPVFLVLSGCGQKEDRVAMQNAVNSASSVSAPAIDSAQMKRMMAARNRVVLAVQKAHSTLPRFIQTLQKPKPSQSQFSIKCAVSDKGQKRHVWMNDVTFDGKNFHGRLGNRLLDKNAKLGSKIKVAPKGVSDWMYIENRELVGGYTLRALRDSLSAQERASFDKTMPFVVN